MSSTVLNTRVVPRQHDKRPISAFWDSPHELTDGLVMNRLPSAMSWDPDLDRWINEGGALCSSQNGDK
jgi:hypothetical protein